MTEIDKSYHGTVRVLRELHLLFSLRHNNIISLENLKVDKKYLYIVTEYCEYSLFTIIDDAKLRINIFKKPSDYTVILYQMLQAVNFLHSSGVLHRDIKPGNVLLDDKLNLKLCDFGLARVVESIDLNEKSETKPLTEYMVTRWYRAPEVVLNPGKYGTANDIWSIACTFAEVIAQFPLFPSTSTVDQVRVIVETLGAPSKEDMNFEMSKRSRKFLRTLIGNAQAAIQLDKMLMKANILHSQMIELFLEMLQFNPHLRISAADALTWSMFDEFRSTTSGASSSSSSSSSSSPPPEICWDRYNTCLEKLSNTQSCEERLELITEEVAHIVSELQTGKRETEGDGKGEGTERSFGQKCRAVLNQVVSVSTPPENEGASKEEETESLSDRIFSAVKLTWDTVATLTSIPEDGNFRLTINKSNKKVFPVRIKPGSKNIMNSKPRLPLKKKPTGRSKRRKKTTLKQFEKDKDVDNDERLDGTVDITEPFVSTPQPIHSMHVNVSNPYRAEHMMLT
eukprot:CAMPEP_0182419134 /NCGR_PEP_ID=MMETSP1167-20130531/3537_1 /TAXON_ID=2988 /ORGANISM="Mallomonas Sp, Strain CCMP3275" /LENGTH=509 /DNA_ID=CAMNT_0024593783 /DNA_START=125 /DNA_END=1654 /DNA_ORIENTATION=-